MPSAEENSNKRRHRLAARRAAIGLNQDDVATAIGVSRQTVGRWESGASNPQPAIRRKLAKVLHVSADELSFLLVNGADAERPGPTTTDTSGPRLAIVDSGELASEGDPVDRRHFITMAGGAVASTALSPASMLQDLVLVLVEPATAADPSADLSISSLSDGLAAMKRAFQACDYDTVVDGLPDLLTRLAAGGQYVGGDDRRTVAGLAAQAHHVAASVLLKLDNHGVAAIAADRSMDAARRSEDPVIIGSSCRILTHTLMASGQMEAAHRYAAGRADALSGELLTDDPNSLSVYGSLLLRGSVAAGNAEDSRTARALLDEAEEAAYRLGHTGNHQWTAFGPDNVLAHRMAVEISLGNAGNAIDYLRRIRLDHLGIAERRVVVCIDAARAYTQWGKHDRALGALQAAEQVSTKELRVRPVARELVQQIRSTGPASVQGELQDLVERVGIAA
jgi:transcriptional regulator with XRE-family HTH domain